jgi:hypothetical protein
MIRRFIDILFLCAILVVVGFAITNREKFVSMSKSSSTEQVANEGEEEISEEPINETQQADNEDVIEEKTE